MKKVAIYTYAGHVTEGLKEKLEAMGCKVSVYTDDDMRYRGGVDADTVFYHPCGCCLQFTFKDLIKFISDEEMVVVVANASATPIRMHGVIENPTPEKLIRAARKLHRIKIK